jgi:aspartyl-tRNA(Asn)/glutamyl-tRNA(Gln) amidotransferase subunit C
MKLTEFLSMISEETVTLVARLARLALAPEETQRYTQELGKILQMIDQLAELDLSDKDIEMNLEHATLFRPDKHKANGTRKMLLSNAPQEEDGFFRVPKILDEGN